jgi:hypothetical protein
MISRCALLLLCGVSLAAQQPAAAHAVAPRVHTPCSYESCALGIAPSWNGLDVVHGANGARVASLGFFLPRDISPAFAGNDSALSYAVRAVKVRRVAATLTNVGALMLGYVAIRARRGDGLRGSDRITAAIGATAFAVSVPLQFSADGLLSRAVWWHNARFAR